MSLNTLTLIDQIDKRVLKGETIPHNEKIFSLFEPHTEWIMKGKSGVPFELGIKVAIVQDPALTHEASSILKF